MLVCTGFYLPYWLTFNYKAGAHWYTRAFFGAVLSYAIVVYKSFPVRPCLSSFFVLRVRMSGGHPIESTFLSFFFLFCPKSFLGSISLFWCLLGVSCFYPLYTLVILPLLRLPLPPVVLVLPLPTFDDVTSLHVFFCFFWNDCEGIKGGELKDAVFFFLPRWTLDSTRHSDPIQSLTSVSISLCLQPFRTSNSPPRSPRPCSLRRTSSIC